MRRKAKQEKSLDPLMQRCFLVCRQQVQSRNPNTREHLHSACSAAGSHDQPHTHAALVLQTGPQTARIPSPPPPTNTNTLCLQCICLCCTRPSMPQPQQQVTRKGTSMAACALPRRCNLPITGTSQMSLTCNLSHGAHYSMNPDSAALSQPC